jgi:hypothetical protein
MTSWQGDLGVTMFIRFLLSRSYLFVEAAHTVVPPIRAEFKAIDEEDPDLQPGQFFRLIGGGLVSTLPRLLGSLPGIVHELGSDGRRERKRRRVEQAGDYGALLSIREAAADTKWHRYFQVFDDARYVKVIQQRIFRSLVINNGVMVTGSGTVNAEAIAAGANARAAGGGLAAQAANLASRVRGESAGGQSE